MIDWARTARLILDRDGLLWVILRDADGDLDGHRRLGPIEDVAGDVAEDLAVEAAGLLDLWRDAFDDRAEQLRSYRLSAMPRIL